MRIRALRRDVLALTGAAAAVVLGATGLVVAASPSAAAVVLDVTATPSTGLRAGDQVVLSVSNLDATSLILAGQCDASIVQAPDPFTASQRQCTTQLLLRPPDGRVTRTVVEAITAPGLPAPVHCGDAPGDCVMFVSSDVGSIGFAPIDVVPSPLAVAPLTVNTRASFSAFVSGDPGAAVTVAQCAAPVADTLAGGDCPVTVPLTLDGTGRGTALVRPVLTIPTAAGTVDCRSGGCALATFDAAGSRLASVAVTVVMPTFRLDAFPNPAERLVDGQQISVVVSADTTEPLLVAQCAASITETRDIAGGPCRNVQEVTVPAPVPGTLTISYDVARSFVGEDGSEVDCSPFFACVLAVDTVADDDVSLATRPIEFEHPPPVVTTSDTTRLLDGEPVTIDITGLKPGANFVVGVCDRPFTPEILFAHCSPATTPGGPLFFVVADAAGNVHTTLLAVQRFTGVAPLTPAYCRDQCRLFVADNDSTIEVPYTMAQGQVSVSPATQLSDGQTVTLTGRRLMASYPGPVVDGAPTGRWTAYQCGPDVGRDPSPAGVARNCVADPAAVTVPASGALTLDLAVHATIQPPQGPAIDCTLQGPACRVVLHRVEQDGTTTLRQAQIRFRR